MALTKVSGGVLENGIDVAGIVTATGFDGPFTGGSSRNVTAGIGTFTGLDVNGNVDISGDLTVQGDTTTLNTTLRNVELLRVSTASTLPAGIITQTGTGDILNLYDGSTEVFTVGDGNKVGIADSIYHIGDDNTAIRFPAADVISFETAGSERLRIHENGTISAGVDNDAYELTLQGKTGGAPTLWLRDGTTSGNPRILFGDSSSVMSGIYHRNNGDSLNFYTNGEMLVGDERMAILSGGNVGIGTNNPENGLHVSDGSNYASPQNSGAGKVMIEHASSADLQFMTANSGYNHIFFGDQDDANIGSIVYHHASNTNAMVFNTNTEEKVRITSDGDVGIGTDAPDVLLHAESDGSTGITFEGSSSNTNHISGDAGTYLSLKNKSATDNNFSNILGVDAGGQATSQISFISEDQSTNAGMLAFGTRVADGTMAERLRITSTGVVNIGANNLDQGTYKAQIETTTNKFISFGNAAHDDLSNEGSGIFFSRPSDGSKELSGIFSHSNGGLGVAAREGITFHVAGGSSYGSTDEALRINTDGEVSIGTASGGKTLTLYGVSSSSFRISKAGVLAYDHTFDGSTYEIKNNNGSAGIPIVLGTKTSGGESLRIDASGRVAIGTSTEGNSKADDLTIATSAHTGMTIRSGTSHEGNIFFSDGTSGADEYQGIIRFDHNDDALKFNTTGSLRLTIDSDGKATFTEEIATPQDYPNYRPTVDFNFVAVKKLDPRFTYVRTGPASYINHLGFVRLVGANVPRFDHDPDTGESKGLLIEESRINLIPNSFDKGTWSAGTAGTLTRNAGIAPDGTNTATKASTTSNDIDVGPQLGNASAGATGQISISGGTTYTLSIWAKASTTSQVGNNFKVRWKRVQGDSTFSENTFALTANWTRYSTTATTAANNSTVACYVGGVSGSEALVWGAQLEAGAYATSLIPTNGSSATRGADVVTMEGEEFTDFYNQEEGTIVLSASYTEDQRTSAIVTIDDTSNSSEYTEVGYRAGGGGSASVGAYLRTDASGDQYYKAFASSATQGNEFKVAFGYKDDDYASSANGQAVHTDTSGTTSKVYDRLRFNHVDTVSPPIGSGHIRRFMYYPTRLPNSQLKTLST